MTRHPKGLRRPIETTFHGQSVTLVTVGYLARAANRTTWTIHYWQRIGLLPKPPFHTNHPNPLYRRGVYPEPFVRRVVEIVSRNQIGDRLDRRDWFWFRDEVFAAYDQTVRPLLATDVDCVSAFTASRCPTQLPLSG